MSEIRSVSVHLDADVAGYIAKMRLAGAATDQAFGGSSKRQLSGLGSELGNVEHGLDRVTTSANRTTTATRGMGNEVDRSRVKVDAGLRSIDKYSGRLGLIVSALTAVGPAAIPLTAVAIPAVAGLATEVGLLAAGVGVGVLAFHGLGAALTAFNKAELAPTAANIQAAQTAMDKLPPSAQAFVVELHRLNPELDKLRQSAASGIFPGVTDGLRSVVADSPLAQRAVHGIAQELGSLAREAGDQLGGPKGRDFLRFVGHEAPVSLDHMGASVGHVTSGLFQLVKAFTPLNHDVDAGILRLAQDFDHWATGLGRTKDFQSFVAYIETNGPHVVALLGDTAQLFGHIVEAAAPLGGPTVQALDLVVKALDAIANSPLATPLLALAQLYSVVRLVSNGFSGIGKSLSGGTGFGGKIASNAKQATSSLAIMTSAEERAMLTSRELAAVESERTKARNATLLKGGALLAGFGLVASGAADKAGLASTASLALAGSFAGPWGAAVGGAIGLTADLTHANNDLADSAGRAKKAFESEGSSIDFSGQSRAVADLQRNIADSKKARDDFFASSGDSATLTGAFKEGTAIVGDFFTHTTDKAKEAADEVAVSSSEIRTAFGALFTDLGGKGKNAFGQDLVLTNQQLQQTADRALPAMQALGISVDDLQQAAAAGDGSLAVLTGRITTWINRADSAAGRSQAVAQAFSQMSDASLTTEQRVDGLTTALDALIDPMLNVGQAGDAFHQGLNDLSQGLSKSSKSLRGNSDAAIQNRNAIRSQVSNLKTFIEAQAKAGVAPQKMAATLRQGRQAIIDEGRAAGLNAGQIRHMIDVMGLTPKQIRTTIQLLGAQQADAQVNGLRSQLEGLNGRVFHTTISVTRVGVSDLTATGGHVLRAEGGTVPGRRYPYADRTLVLAAPGEEIITNRHGEADRFRSDRATGRIPAYADGGTVATHVTSSPAGLFRSTGVGAAADEAARGLRGLRGALADSTKELDAERQHRQALGQARQQLSSTVTGNFRSDIFGATADNGIWSGGATIDPDQIIRRDTRNARQYIHKLRRLRRRGLRGGALGEVDTLEEAQQAAGLSNRELREITRDFAIRQHVSGLAGNVAGNLRFGAQIAQSNRHLAQIQHEVHQTNVRLHALEHAQSKHPKAIGSAVGDAINGAAATAARRGRSQ